MYPIKLNNLLWTKPSGIKTTENERKAWLGRLQVERYSEGGPSPSEKKMIMGIWANL